MATAAKPVFTGIGHTGDETVADIVAARACITPTECGQQIVEVTRQWWADMSAEPAALLARRVPAYLAEAQARDAQARGRLTASGAPAAPGPPGAPGPEGVVAATGGTGQGCASSAARLRTPGGAAGTV